MRNHRILPFISLAIMMMAALASPAKADVVGVFTSGQYSFDYSGPGTYDGDFFADGEEFEASGTFGGTQTNACGGFFDKNIPDVDTTVMTLYAAILNTDGTVDAAVLWVTNLDDGVPAGNYPITLAGTDNKFVFIDNIEAFEPPADYTDVAELIAWARDLEAGHILISSSGSITIQEAAEELAVGTFSGSMLDANNPFFSVSVTNGTFSYEGVVPVTQNSFGHLKALFR